MADSVEKVLDIKVNYSEAVKAIAEYQTAIDGLKQEEQELKKALKDGTIQQQEYNEKMTESKVKTNELREAQKVIQKQMEGQLIHTSNFLSDFLKIVSFSLHIIANLQFIGHNRSHPLHERGLSDGIASYLTPLIIMLMFIVYLLI